MLTHDMRILCPSVLALLLHGGLRFCAGRHRNRTVLVLTAVAFCRRGLPSQPERPETGTLPTSSMGGALVNLGAHGVWTGAVAKLF